MKLYQHVRIVRIWSPHSIRIRQKFFLKSEILFGSDQSCDVQISGIDELYARLDFNAKEIHFLKSDRVDPLEPGELFQVGIEIFQWKEINFNRPEWKWTVASLFAGTLLIVVTCALYTMNRSEGAHSCSPKWEKISTGRWQAERGNIEEEKFFQPLIEIKKSFQVAVKAKAWAKARAELNLIQEMLAREVEPGCGVSGEAPHLEAQLSRALISEYLRDGRIETAAEEIQRFRKKFHSDSLDRLESRIIRGARKIYFEGYRLEEEDSEKSSDLMESAEQACKLLELPPQCYKPKQVQAQLGKRKSTSEED